MEYIHICENVFPELSLRLPSLENMTISWYRFVHASNGYEINRHYFTIDMPNTSLHNLSIRSLWDSWEWDDDYELIYVKLLTMEAGKKKIKYYSIDKEGEVTKWNTHRVQGMAEG
jgi:hypothetical protein